MASLLLCVTRFLRQKGVPNYIMKTGYVVTNPHKEKTTIGEALALAIVLTVGATPTFAVHNQGASSIATLSIAMGGLKR
jgi:hypothetical protein